MITKRNLSDAEDMVVVMSNETAPESVDAALSMSEEVVAHAFESVWGALQIEPDALRELFGRCHTQLMMEIAKLEDADPDHTFEAVTAHIGQVCSYLLSVGVTAARLEKGDDARTGKHKRVTMMDMGQEMEAMYDILKPHVSGTDDGKGVERKLNMLLRLAALCEAEDIVASDVHEFMHALDKAMFSRDRTIGETVQVAFILGVRCGRRSEQARA